MFFVNYKMQLRIDYITLMCRSSKKTNGPITLNNLVSYPSFWNPLVLLITREIFLLQTVYILIIRKKKSKSYYYKGRGFMPLPL